MTTSMSLSVSDEGYQNFVLLKNRLGKNQSDAMSILLENMDINSLIDRVNHEKDKEPCAVDIARTEPYKIKAAVRP